MSDRMHSRWLKVKLACGDKRRVVKTKTDHKHNHSKEQHPYEREGLSADEAQPGGEPEQCPLELLDIKERFWKPEACDEEICGLPLLIKEVKEQT